MMTARPGPPASIHDPITPFMATYLPAFYWNVIPDALSVEERQRQRNNDCAKARYQRVRAKQLAERDMEAWADASVQKLIHTENQNRPAHVPRPVIRRSKA